MTSTNPLPLHITTARLVLRAPRPADDAPALVENWASDPEVTRYLLWMTYSPGDVASAELFLGLCADNWASGVGHRPWAICERLADGASGSPIGMIGVTPGSAPHSLEVGYVLGRAWWGKGYTTEAVVAVVDALFALGSIWRVYAPTHADNRASQRVLEKAGFTREGTLRRLLVFPRFGPEPQDCALFSFTRDDLAARRPSPPAEPSHAIAP
ncbi:MAG: GNAT family N-acetyltransferase [Deltaproteobacteria bacterium]|nr:GNAT family N-acetyltransferase [Deltaproteobacteria bacterium]